MTQWEYAQFISCATNDNDTMRELNSLGRDGWELVHLERLSNNVYYMKRSVTPEASR